MNRFQFIKSLVSIPIAMTLKPLDSLRAFMNAPDTERPMPVLFLGHGSPMNAIEDNPYTRGWKRMVKDIPTPKAILVISAHWETRGGTQVFAGKSPRMIYDMYGFPRQLYQVKYPAPGAPEIAAAIQEKIPEITADHEWGLDHGAWSVLMHTFPEADIPCFQLSLNYTRDMQWHYDLAQQLAFLRRKGVLILGSGNIVHNLRELRSMDMKVTDWSLEFDAFVADRIKNRDHQALVNYEKFGKSALISVNSAEHYIPMLYTLALQEKGEKVTFTNVGVDDTLLGSYMRSFKIS